MMRPISSVLVDFRQAASPPPVSAPAFAFDEDSFSEEEAVEGQDELPQQAEDLALEQDHAEAAAAAAAEHAEALEAARAAMEEQVEARLSEAREHWVEAEGARLAEHFDAALSELRDMIAARAAAVLHDLVRPALREKMLDELLQTIDTLTRQDQAMILRIEGSADLLESIRKNLAGRVRSLDLVESEGSDVRVIAQDTVIESHLGQWLAQVAGETAA